MKKIIISLLVLFSFSNAQVMDRDDFGHIMPILGKGDLTIGAWGKQKTIQDNSIFNAFWTFDVPDKMWIEYIDGVEGNKTNFTSENGMLKGVSNGATSYLMSKRHPRYQANRGILYSNSLILDSNASLNNGELLACVLSDGNETCRNINYPSWYNPAKGNIYDIQSQWRGVGNIGFFIGQKNVYTFKFLGTLNGLSVQNPTLPLGFEASLGKVKFGSFGMTNGIYFKWKFDDNSTETQFRSGCVDLSSEGGRTDDRYFVSANLNTLNGDKDLSGYDDEVIAIRIPEMLNGKMNTRDVVLNLVSLYSNSKSLGKIWYTRDNSAILSGTWSPINGGNIEVSEDLEVDFTKSLLLTARRVNVDQTENIINQGSGKFFLTHGDYIIVTMHKENGATSIGGASIEMAEEI